MFKFTIVGDPRGKGRPRFMRSGHTYTDQKTRDYENKVRAAFIDQGGEMMEGPIMANITAVFAIPESYSKKRKRELYGEWYMGKPDRDNVEKIVLDALNGIAYRDDSAVVTGNVTKRYVDLDEVPKVEVFLTTLPTQREMFRQIMEDNSWYTGGSDAE